MNEGNLRFAIAIVKGKRQLVLAHRRTKEIYDIDNQYEPTVPISDATFIRWAAISEL